MPGTSFFHQARNNAWSNHRLFDVCQKLTKHELSTKRAAFSPTLLESLNHALTVDWYYLDALVNGRRGQDCFANEMPYIDIAKLAAAQRDADFKLMAFCDQLNDKDAVREVELKRADGTVGYEAVADILSHLFVYQTHHRGQVHVMLGNTAQSPPPLEEYHLEFDAPFRNFDFSGLGGKGI
ncbi:MAG: DinB family protein [Thalassospira sp.]|uniref:DinB family protein n=1 Tax=Thalassospira sp. TaxID=1912094 RepID=UPI0032EC25C9